MRELSPIDWAVRPLQRFAEFRGRAPRAEYWWYYVGVGITGFLLGLADTLILHMRIWGNHGPLGLFFTIVMIVPGLSLLVRHLHDTNRTGWWAVLKLPSLAVILGGANPIKIARAFTGPPPRFHEERACRFATPLLYSLDTDW